MKVPVPKVIIAADTLKEQEQISGAREDISVKREQIHITHHEKVNMTVKKCAIQQPAPISIANSILCQLLLTYFCFLSIHMLQHT